MKTINCFFPFDPAEPRWLPILQALRHHPRINKIYLLSGSPLPALPEGCEHLPVATLTATATLRTIATLADTPYTLLTIRPLPVDFGPFAIERFLRVAEDTGAGMLYADRHTLKNGVAQASPVIDYQYGSLRDDFDFGTVLFYRTQAMKEAIAGMDTDYRYAGLYDLRLKISRHYELVHLNEYLYTEEETDSRRSGDKLFDYVNPKNREVQIEMEAACTNHLKQIGAYLEPRFREVDFSQDVFPCEASVIIPVRNRIRTIEDAIRSVLIQQTTFPFNLIVIDNHSTDGTSQAIEKYTSDPRVIHLVPGQTGLGIGGCWNTGVHDARCGKFAVQLDSDDLYSDEHTLQKIVDAFYRQKCAMVVGTYRMTDFALNTLPPGIIDHREWTPANGRNNALRINGLGAPRAFYTPLLREIQLPDTSYGEDYAVGLALSRHYLIGRIYEVLYLCRRWEDNSDAALDIEKMNAHNTYKDRIRTWEVQARIALNRKK